MQKYSALHNYFMANLAYVAQEDKTYKHGSPCKVTDAVLKQKYVRCLMFVGPCITVINEE